MKGIGDFMKTNVAEQEIVKKNDISDYIVFDNIEYEMKKMKVHELYTMYKNKELVKPPYQITENAWSLATKGSFIASLFVGYVATPISISEPGIKVVKRGRTAGKKQGYIEDGLQRLNTILKVINNEIRIVMSKSQFTEGIIEGKPYDIFADMHNKYFKDLPDIYRDRILKCEVDVKVYKTNNMEFLEKAFIILNSDVQLRKSEIDNAVIGNNRDILRPLFAKHSCFTRMKIGEKSIEHGGDIDIISQIFMLIKLKRAANITDNKVNRFLMMYKKDGIPSTDYDELDEVLTYMDAAVDMIITRQVKNTAQLVDSRKNIITVFSKINFITMTYYASEAIREGVPVETFANFMVHFFNNVSDEYLRLNMQGAYYLGSMKKRFNIVDNAFYKFIARNMK